MEPENIAYQFTQKVERLERDSEESPGIRESYERGGVLLLTSERGLTEWNRTLVEYVASPAQLTGWREESAVPRAAMREIHLDHVAGHSLELALDLPLQLTSGPLNGDLAALGAAVPFFALGLPTVLPSFGGFRPEPGYRFDGETRIAYGFGAFTAGHQCEVVNVSGPRVALRVELGPKESWAAGRRVLLVLKPAGAIQLTLDTRDFLPERIEGKYTLAFRNQWQAGGETRSLEVGRLACEFATRRIPAAFDDEMFRPVGWRRDAFAPPGPA